MKERIDEFQRNDNCKTLRKAINQVIMVCMGLGEAPDLNQFLFHQHKTQDHYNTSTTSKT